MPQTRSRANRHASTTANLAFIVAAISLTLATFLGQNQQFVDLAIAASVLCGLIGIFTNAIVRAPFLAWALTPVGLMLCFMILAFGLVPTMWALDLHQPWEEVRGREDSAVAAGILLLAAFAVGVWIARPKFERGDSPNFTHPCLSMFLFGCFLIGLTGYLLLAVVAGGPLALLHTLADRRDSLAGTGPLRSLLLVAAVGCLAGIAQSDKSSNQTRLTWLCGITYFALNLLTGARFQALIIVIAAFAVHVRIHGPSRAVIQKIVLALLAAVPASTFYALRVRQGLTYGTDVQVVDDSSAISALGSLVGPFVNGGIDSLRTLGVVAEQAPTLGFNVSPLIGSVTNVIPRSLWEGKPDGSATEFSARYFPDRWADGTGVPPSISAELMNTFGFVGGLFAMAVVGLLIARGSVALYNRSSWWSLIVLGLITADSLQLVKGGSDGFVRSVTMQGVAILIAMSWSKIARAFHPSRRRKPFPRRPAVQRASVQRQILRH